MATRKKYKIVLSEKYVSKSENGKEWFQFPLNISGQLVAIQTIIPLDPYTEPDLEQVRKEAFEEGKKQAKVQAELDVCHDIEKVAKGNYNTGLADAWECMNRILDMSCEQREQIFSKCKAVGVWDLLHEYSATEAIEKIRQYEQEQEAFHVGDEFVNGNGDKFVITKMDGEEIDRYIDEYGRTYRMNAKYKVMRKTGRHFPEIAEVLQKMKES